MTWNAWTHRRLIAKLLFGQAKTRAINGLHRTLIRKPPVQPSYADLQVEFKRRVLEAGPSGIIPYQGAIEEQILKDVLASTWQKPLIGQINDAIQFLLDREYEVSYQGIRHDKQD